MTRKQLKTENIERFLTFDPPNGSEFNDLSDEDTEITDESLFDSHLNINDDGLSDDLCFEQDQNAWKFYPNSKIKILKITAVII